MAIHDVVASAPSELILLKELRYLCGLWSIVMQGEMHVGHFWN